MRTRKNKNRSRKNKNRSRSKRRRRTSRQCTRTHRRRRSLRGGRITVYNDSEGRVVVDTDTGIVTKEYKADKFFHDELNGFRLFDLVDPDHQFHPRILEVKDEPKTLVMEYVGETVGSDMKNNVEPYIAFLIHALHLRDREGNYVFHMDGHANNVCINDQGQVKFIDLGSVKLIPANSIVTKKIANDLSYVLSSLYMFAPEVFDSWLKPQPEGLVNLPYEEAIRIVTVFLENLLSKLSTDPTTPSNPHYARIRSSFTPVSRGTPMSPSQKATPGITPFGLNSPTPRTAVKARPPLVAKSTVKKNLFASHVNDEDEDEEEEDEDTNAAVRSIRF